MKLRHSIRARMTLGVSLAMGLLLLASSCALVWNAKHTAEQHADSLLAVAAHKVEREANLDAAHIDVAEMMADERDFASQNLAMMLLDEHGQMLQKSQNSVPVWPRRQDGWRVTTVRVGSNLAVIGFHWRVVEQALKEQAVVLGSLSLIVFLTGSVGVWFLIGRTLSPISRLSHQAEAASAENLHVRLYSPSEDVEMVQLADTLNGLLSRLAQAAAARERFYAAASHELRTPLQALTGHLGLALRRPREAAEYEKVMREAQDQVRRLNSLVSDLLLLNQLETAPAPSLAPVDLTLVCRQTLGDYALLIQQRCLIVQTEMPAEFLLSAPPTHVAMLLRNTVENALKYAPKGGCIQVVLDTETKQLLISNAFESTFHWEQDKLFEPFFRPDASRSSETGGNGLGLALCKAIANANGWTINLEYKTPSVLCTMVFGKQVTDAIQPQ